LHISRGKEIELIDPSPPVEVEEEDLVVGALEEKKKKLKNDMTLDFGAGEGDCVGATSSGMNHQRHNKPHTCHKEQRHHAYLYRDK
jgi:hypothetical protein